MSCPSFCTTPDCTLPYGRHISFSIGGDALVSRSSREANATRQMSKAWEKDLPAYKRLRDDGLRPAATEGAAELERRATCEEHVTTGLTHVSERAFKEFESSFGHKASEAAS